MSFSINKDYGPELQTIQESLAAITIELKRITELLEKDKKD